LGPGRGLGGVARRGLLGGVGEARWDGRAHSERALVVRGRVVWSGCVVGWAVGGGAAVGGCVVFGVVGAVVVLCRYGGWYGVGVGEVSCGRGEVGRGRAVMAACLWRRLGSLAVIVAWGVGRVVAWWAARCRP